MLSNAALSIRLWVVASILAVMSPVVWAQAQPVSSVSEWQEYRQADDGFLVRVPNAVKAWSSHDGGRSAGHYVSGTAEQTLSVLAIRWPLNQRNGKSAAALAEETAHRALTGMQAQQIERNDVHNCDLGVPGRALKARLQDDLIYVAQICVTSGHIYRVEAFVVSSRWQDAAQNVAAFLNSFKPLRP